MDNLKTLNPEIFGTLLDLSIAYIQGDFQVLSKVPFSSRNSFSSTVEYLRTKCGKHSSEYIKEIEEENWDAEHKSLVIEKMKEYDSDFYRRKNKNRINDANWRIDVSLSTNSLSRVLKAEIQCRLSNGSEDTDFHMNVAQFQELRRQTASLIKDVFSMDQFAFIRNLK